MGTYRCLNISFFGTESIWCAFMSLFRKSDTNIKTKTMKQKLNFIICITIAMKLIENTNKTIGQQTTNRKEKNQQTANWVKKEKKKKKRATMMRSRVQSRCLMSLRLMLLVLCFLVGCSGEGDGSREDPGFPHVVMVDYLLLREDFPELLGTLFNGGSWVDLSTPLQGV